MENIVKIKESEKIDKWKDRLCQKTKKLLDMRVTVVLDVIDLLGAVTKGFEKTGDAPN